MMSTDATDASAAPAPVSAAPATAGAYLRQARQAQGMHIAVLAATLKVSQRKLEAIEADRYQELADPTFVRALALAMCRALKINAAPVLALLPAAADPELERVSRGLNQPFRERSTRDEGLSLDLLTRPIFWVPALLVAATAALLLAPTNWLDHLASELNKPQASEVTPALPPASDNVQLPPAAEMASAPTVEAAEQAASAPTLVPQTAVEDKSPPAVVPTKTAVADKPTDKVAEKPVINAPVGNAAVASAPVAAVRAASPPASSALVSGSTPLRLKATADTWVKVADADGQVLLARLMHAGDVIDLGVKTPVTVRIGNVSGTALSLRGVPVDLPTQSKDNVAQIELK